MNLSKEEILQKLKESNGIGFVELNGVLHEIRLINENQITFSGACWKWEQTEMPSSNGDYSVLTDVLIEEDPIMHHFPLQHSYVYYETVSDFLS
ncbi:hypothetical protein [Ferdinandcohnia sp. Marseille-Q9671]